MSQNVVSTAETVETANHVIHKLPGLQVPRTAHAADEIEGGVGSHGIVGKGEMAFKLSATIEETLMSRAEFRLLWALSEAKKRSRGAWLELLHHLGLWHHRRESRGRAPQGVRSRRMGWRSVGMEHAAASAMIRPSLDLRVQAKEGCVQRTSCYEFRSQASTVRSVLNQGQMYHSIFVNKEGIAKACGCPLLPLKSHIKGPAPVSDQDTNDVIDEAIMFFRANIFFRNFNIQSSADKLLIYLTLYLNIALKRLEGCRTLAEGTNAIINLGLERVPVPGEPDFPLGSLFSLPQSKQEAELFRNYLRQLREDTSGKLLSRAYRPNGTPNKWWLAFAKRKFISIVHHSTSS